MADQVYNLTQTGAEVQAIINDANNAKGAGATTSLSTDYIMLKDTNGQYHKIQKESFTEAVRNTLASLLVNNDKGTTISQIAAIASGDFGSVTPANLASVLGGVVTGINANENLNNYKTQGTYICGSGSAAQTISNCPLTVAFRLDVLYFSGTVWIQRIISADADAVYIRVYRNNDTWSSWYKYQGAVVQ